MTCNLIHQYFREDFVKDSSSLIRSCDLSPIKEFLLVFCVLVSSFYKNSLFSQPSRASPWNFKDNVYVTQKYGLKIWFFTQMRYRHGFAVVRFCESSIFWIENFFYFYRKKFLAIIRYFLILKLSTEEEIIFLQWSFATTLFFFSGHLAWSQGVENRTDKKYRIQKDERLYFQNNKEEMLIFINPYQTK